MSTHNYMFSWPNNKKVGLPPLICSSEITLLFNHYHSLGPGPDKSIAQLPGTSPNLAGLVIFYFTCPEKCIEYIGNIVIRRPRWLSWMRRPTEDQEVAGSTPAEVGNILSWRLIMKYFLRSFSPFRWFKKGSCQFLAKECAQYWLTA